MKKLIKASSQLVPGCRSLMSILRHFPAGLIGCVILISIMEIYLFFYKRNTCIDIANTWQWSNWSATHEARDSRILCFGDSLVKFGVVPRIIENQTKLPTCNLAVFEGRSVTFYLLLKKVLGNGAQPAVIVLDNGLLYKDPVEYPWIWPEIASPSEAAELGWLGRNATFFAHFGLAYGLASIRYRDELRLEVTSSLFGLDSKNRFIHRLNQRNWTYNKGASIVPSSMFVKDPAPKELEHDMMVNGIWACHPINEIYNKKFLDLAQSRNILVFWLLPPTHPGLALKLDRPAWNGLQKKFLLDLQQKYANLFVVDGTCSGYDATVMDNLVHMNSRGACAFSTSVGIILNERLNRKSKDNLRWITLSPFQDVIDPPVEDITQSSRMIEVK